MADLGDISVRVDEIPSLLREHSRLATECERLKGELKRCATERDDAMAKVRELVPNLERELAAIFATAKRVQRLPPEAETVDVDKFVCNTLTSLAGDAEIARTERGEARAALVGAECLSVGYRSERDVERARAEKAERERDSMRQRWLELERIQDRQLTFDQLAIELSASGVDLAAERARREAAEALVAKWRAEAASRDSLSAVGALNRCARELEAVFQDSTGSPPDAASTAHNETGNATAAEPSRDEIGTLERNPSGGRNPHPAGCLCRKCKAQQGIPLTAGTREDPAHMPDCGSRGGTGHGCAPDCPVAALRSEPARPHPAIAAMLPPSRDEMGRFVLTAIAGHRLQFVEALENDSGEDAVSEVRHFSHCKGCGGEFTCNQCKTVVGLCFDACRCEEYEQEETILVCYYDPQDTCSECAYREDLENAERDRENMHLHEDDW